MSMPQEYLRSWVRKSPRGAQARHEKTQGAHPNAYAREHIIGGIQIDNHALSVAGTQKTGSIHETITHTQVAPHTRASREREKGREREKERERKKGRENERERRRERESVCV